MTDHKTLINEYLHALSGKAKPSDVVAKYVADEQLAAHIGEVEAAFPMYELTAQDLISEADKVMLRAEFRGVHRGAFAGIEPTGRAVSAGLLIVYRISEGRIVQHWMQFDTFGLLNQLRGVSQEAA